MTTEELLVIGRVWLFIAVGARCWRTSSSDDAELKNNNNYGAFFGIIHQVFWYTCPPHRGSPQVPRFPQFCPFLRSAFSAAPPRSAISRASRSARQSLTSRFGRSDLVFFSYIILNIDFYDCILTMNICIDLNSFSYFEWNWRAVFWIGLRNAPWFYTRCD